MDNKKLETLVTLALKEKKYFLVLELFKNTIIPNLDLHTSNEFNHFFETSFDIDEAVDQLICLGLVSKKESNGDIHTDVSVLKVIREKLDCMSNENLGTCFLSNHFKANSNIGWSKNGN